MYYEPNSVEISDAIMEMLLARMNVLECCNEETIEEIAREIADIIERML